MAPLLRLLLLLAALTTSTHSVPINRQPRLDGDFGLGVQNTTYDIDQTVCVVDDVLYRAGDSVATANACERCVCSPPEFICAPLACPFRAGCKAVQSPGECCPQYNCECELDGRIYQNGEKVLTTDRPCHVCYCRGGHIVCAPLECYRRSDCTPRLEPGSCCPKYDHCPPLENVLRKRFHQHITPSPPLEPDNHLHRTLLLEEDQQLDSTNTDERIVRLGETPVSLAASNIHESDEIPQSDEAVRSEEGSDMSQNQSSVTDSKTLEGSTTNITTSKPEETTSINPIATTSTPVLKKVVVLTLNDFYNKDMEEFKNRIDAQKEVADSEVNTVESDPPLEMTTPYSKTMVENSDEPAAVHIAFVSDDVSISLPSEDSNNSTVGSGENLTEKKSDTDGFLSSNEGSGSSEETDTTSVTTMKEVTASFSEISLNKNFSMSETPLPEEELLIETTTEPGDTRKEGNKFTLLPDENFTSADEGASDESSSSEGTSYMSENSVLTTEESVKDQDSTISSENENKVEEELLLKDLNYNYRKVNTDGKDRTDSDMLNSNVDFTTESKTVGEPTTEISSQEFIPSNIYVRVISDEEDEKVGIEHTQTNTTPQEDITTDSDITEGYTSVNNSNVIDHIGKASELFLSSVSEEEDEDEAGGEWKDLTTDNIVYLYDKTDSYPTTIDAFPVNQSSTTEENDSNESSMSSEHDELKTTSLPETTTQFTSVVDTTQELTSLNIKKLDDTELVQKSNISAARKEDLADEMDSSVFNVTNVENINKTLVLSSLINNDKIDVTKNNPQIVNTSDVEATTVLLNTNDKEIDNSSPMTTEDSVQATTVVTQEEEESTNHTPMPTEYKDSNTEVSNLGSETVRTLIPNNLSISEPTSETSVEQEKEKSPEIDVADQFIREEPPVLLFKGDMALQNMDVVFAGEMENVYIPQNTDNGKNVRSESESDKIANEGSSNESSHNVQQNKPILILKPVIKKNNSETSKLFEGDDMEGYINDSPLNKEVEILSKDGEVQEVIKVQEGSSHKTINEKPELPMSLPTHPDAEFIGMTILSSTPETTVVTEGRVKDSTDLPESESTLGERTTLSPNTSELSTQLFVEQVTDGSYTKTDDMSDKSEVKILPDVITFRSNISVEKNDTDARLEGETTEMSTMPESWLKESNNSDSKLYENTTGINYKEETTTYQEIQETTEALNKNYMTQKVEETEISASETNSTYTTETAESNFTTETIQAAGKSDERVVRSNPESESDDAIDNTDFLILQDFFRKLYRNQVSENVRNH